MARATNAVAAAWLEQPVLLLLLLWLEQPAAAAAAAAWLEQPVLLLLLHIQMYYHRGRFS